MSYCEGRHIKEWQFSIKCRFKRSLLLSLSEYASLQRAMVLSKKCDDWKHTDNVATDGTMGNTDHDIYTDTNIPQTSHLNYLLAVWSHQVSQAAISTATELDPAYICRQ